MQFDRVLSTFAEFFERERIRFALIGGLAVHVWGRVRPTQDVDFAIDTERAEMMKAVAMKSFPHRTLYEGEDVRTLLKVPGVDRDAIRDYFARHGLLELFDAIEKTR